MEIWKEIPFYTNYEVSSLGRVKTVSNNATRKERILKPLISTKYLRVGLYNEKGLKFFTIHRLVAKAFIPNPENKPQVNHINGIKENNSVENLEWVTYRENINHAIENNLSAGGERNGRSKLNENKVKEIRESMLNRKQLSEIYKVSKSTIDRILSNRGWIKTL